MSTVKLVNVSQTLGKLKIIISFMQDFTQNELYECIEQLSIPKGKD